MPRLTPLLLCGLLLALWPAQTTAQTHHPLNPEVRVLLASQQEVSVTLPGAHRGSVDGGPEFSTPAALEWPVTARDGRLLVDGFEVGRRLMLAPDDALFELNGAQYRGAVTLTANGDSVEVINHVGLESYLRGVVPAEMAAMWPSEALKAQAVAARSYTLQSLDPSAPYDLCATDECQVYRGAAAEHPRTDEAVRATAGTVVTYNGAVARTYYHADSGGMIASSSEVWGAALPYLVARRDANAATPHRAWVSQLDAELIGASLAAEGLGVGTVTGIRITRLSDSGRAAEIEVTGSRGSRLISGARATRLLRSWGLKSTRFKLLGPLRVQGDGWGHGVGMSQYGARALAQAGHDYGSILAYYFPSTTLTRYVSESERAP